MLVKEAKGFSKQYDVITREKKIKDAIRIYHYFSLFSRQILNDLEFTDISAPIIGPATDLGIRGAKRVEFDYYRYKYKVMSSMILYKQAYVRAYERIYAFSPSIRLEEVKAKKAGRHLYEFYQLYLEARDVIIEDTVALFEDYYTKLIERLTKECTSILKRKHRKVTVPTKPFRRITYDDAFKFAEIDFG